MSPEGWRIGIEVKVEGEAAPFVMHCYLTNGDLIMNYPTVPPGECSLRFPFEHNSTWEWKRDNFSYHRRLLRPQTPLQLPIGTLDDLVEVRAENKIVSPDVDKTYETRSTLYFAPHIGLVKVESENPTLDRVLIEYRPGSR